MTISFMPAGVCSRRISVGAENGKITEAEVVGGCSGSLQGICKLLVGMSVEEAISRLSGIECGERGTSCPDQLALAMQQLLKELE